jgi:type IV pilus assembly protein PilA
MAQKHRLENYLTWMLRSEKGFTLVELLVVIVIIGILTAIALPSFLNQTAKAKQTEAKQNVSVVIRSQQLQYSERGTFATTFDDLALGNLRGGATFATDFFDYEIITGSGTSTRLMTITASTRDSSLRSYSGALLVERTNTQKSAWNSIVCVATTFGLPAIAPIDANTCPAGSELSLR